IQARMTWSRRTSLPAIRQVPLKYAPGSHLRNCFEHRAIAFRVGRRSLTLNGALVAGFYLGGAAHGRYCRMSELTDSMAAGPRRIGYSPLLSSAASHFVSSASAHQPFPALR